MKNSRSLHRFSLVAAALFFVAPLASRASDHADPLVLNPLNPPKEREPRITDLHVFLDTDQRPGADRSEAKALIISFCVFPAMPALALADEKDKDSDVITLPPSENGNASTTARYKRPKLDLESYTYRVFLDLHAKLDFSNPGDLARYGGTVLQPEDIAEEVTLEFHLNNDATLKPDYKIIGIESSRVVINAPFQEGAINVRSGIFDDPFIFPRFFRTNVVGIVTSIPLNRFRGGSGNFLIWATTSKDGKQLDHVGRSQRTQLPRFDTLNSLPPRQHVAEINRRHTHPTLGEDFMRTFLSPLFGRRPYDAAPDVMIFRRDKETKFPNGRRLEDDVAALIAETGDTQLWEASYTDDPRFPRATKNDGTFVPAPKTGDGRDDQSPKFIEIALKKYGTEFPYLARPWTVDEFSGPNGRPLPFMLGRPNLSNGSWRTLWLIEVASIIVLALLLFLIVRSKGIRLVLLLIAIVTLWLLRAVYIANDPAIMGQAARKLWRVGLGGGVIAVLTVTWIYALGRRHGAKSCSVSPSVPGDRENLAIGPAGTTGQ